MDNLNHFITASEARKMAGDANNLAYEEAVRKNVERWSIKALEAITKAAQNGKFYAECPIYTERGFPFKEDSFGLNDFCKWLRNFGYDVGYSPSHIKIRWELSIDVGEI